jgi:hypothetical protein
VRSEPYRELAGALQLPVTRGYVYPVDLSIIRWLGLGPHESLELNEARTSTLFPMRFSVSRGRKTAAHNDSIRHTADRVIFVGGSETAPYPNSFHWAQPGEVLFEVSETPFLE